MKHQANEIAHTMDATLFYRDDLNLTGFDRTALALICTHNVLVRTSFPKLAIHLFKSPQFAQIASKASIDKNEETQITCIIDSLSERSSPPQNVLTADDTRLWEIIKQHSVKKEAQNGKLREKHEQNVEETVNTRMSNIYYNHTDDSLTIQQSRRTRKNRVPQEDSTMKYKRSISIS